MLVALGVSAAPASASDSRLTRLDERAVALTLPVIKCSTRVACLGAMSRLVDADTAEVRYITSRIYLARGEYHSGTACWQELNAFRPIGPSSAMLRYLAHRATSHDVVTAQFRFLRSSGAILAAC